jgi:hypothetical protein
LKETSNKAYAIEQEMTEFLDAKYYLNKVPDAGIPQEHGDRGMFHTTDSTVLKLELTVVITSSSFDDLTLKNVLLDTSCKKP